METGRAGVDPVEGVEYPPQLWFRHAVAVVANGHTAVLCSSVIARERDLDSCVGWRMPNGIAYDILETAGEQLGVAGNNNRLVVMQGNVLSARFRFEP